MRTLAAFLVATLLVCLDAQAEKPGSMMISRYTGIVGLVQLGDTEAAILSRVEWANKRVTFSPKHVLASLRFSHMLFFPEVGIRAYFRNDKVALIEVQDPFVGGVQGTRLSVFKLTSSKADKWEEVIQNELGKQPRGRVGNGALNSEAFLYPWGDVAWNASGINEIAMYRDPEIATKFREKHFGRKVEMWTH